MKNQIFLLAAVLTCSALAAAETLETPHIAVYGRAEIKVTPNEMIWSVNVSTKNASLPAVAKNHTETVKQVLDFLKSLEIDKEKLQTSRMQYGEDWKTVNRERIKMGYHASTRISFTISDFDLYQKLWFGLAEIEGVSIQSTRYAHSDRIKYQNESRQKAMLAAREKAVNLAKTLGSQIAEPLKIEEVSAPSLRSALNFNNTSNYASDMGGSYATTDTLALGQISISTQVRVVFRLKNPS